MMGKPPTTHKTELETTINRRSSISVSLKTFVEFYTRDSSRLVSSIGILLVLEGVSLAIGVAHPILGIVAGLIFGVIGVAVPNMEPRTVRPPSGATSRDS